MQTLEYRTIDKANWPRGPWDDEPDKRQWTDEATGLPCMIRRAGSNMGHLCGYVGVPANHPAYGKHYDEVEAAVHGGLTFAARCSDGNEETSICHKVEDGEDDNVWWLGFDCGHYGDESPGMRWRGLEFPDDTYKDFEYVKSEVENLAKQLSEMSN